MNFQNILENFPIKVCWHMLWLCVAHGYHSRLWPLNKLVVVHEPITRVTINQTYHMLSSSP